jgi:hypothetical protein
MTDQSPKVWGKTLEQVHEQLNLWRQKREKKGPFPEEIWEAIVNLSGKYSASKIASVLKLNFIDLKTRIRKRSDTEKLIQSFQPKFIELDFKAPVSENKCIVEITRPDNVSMKMTFIGQRGFDFHALTKTFLSSSL